MLQRCLSQIPWASAWWLSLCLSLCLLGFNGYAKDVGIHLSVDRTEIGIHESAHLTVTIDGAQHADPILPDLSQVFDMQPGSRSSQIQIINGHTRVFLELHYLLLPKQVGQFTIPAAQVQINGHTYHSEPFSLTVREQSEALPEQTPVFVTQEFHPNHGYVGQQIIYSWKLWQQQGVELAQPELTLPDFVDADSENMGQERRYEVVHNGQRYTVTEVRRAIFFHKAATFHLAPAVFSCDMLHPSGGSRGFMDPFGSFFQPVSRERKAFRSHPLEISIQELPPAPEHFSGIVGTLQLAVDLNPKDLHVGDSTTLTVQLLSNAQSQHLHLPELDLPPSSKTYEDKPINEQDNHGTFLLTRKTLKMALVPTLAGNYAVTMKPLIFFDSETLQYKQFNLQAIPIQVKALDGNHSQAIGPLDSNKTATAAPRLFEEPYHQPIAYRYGFALQGRAWLWLNLLFLCCLLPIFYYSAEAYQQFSQQKLPQKLRRQALTHFQETLERLQKQYKSEAVVDPALATTLSKGIRHYLGKKFSIEGTALTPGECRSMLLMAHVEDKHAYALEKILQHLDQAQYDSSKQQETANLQQTIKHINGILKQIDKNF